VDEPVVEVAGSWVVLVTSTESGAGVALADWRAEGLEAADFCAMVMGLVVMICSYCASE
jgi:hypothetical protein